MLGREEIGRFLRIVLPTMCVELLRNALSTELAVFVGQRFGSTALAGASIGSMSPPFDSSWYAGSVHCRGLAVLIGNMCGWSFIIGILSAFDTLAPQACDSAAPPPHSALVLDWHW